MRRARGVWGAERYSSLSNGNCPPKRSTLWCQLHWDALGGGSLCTAATSLHPPDPPRSLATILPTATENSSDAVRGSALRGKQLGGVRFRRQHPIEPYIVDFYCSSARLAIELDGESHDGRETYDDQRTQDIENQRIRVLRVSNDDVLTNLEGVLELISRAVGLAPIACNRARRSDSG